MYRLRNMIGNDVLMAVSQAKNNASSDASRITRYQCTPRVLRPAAHDHHPYKSGRSI